jgi:hypothetical protein
MLFNTASTPLNHFIFGNDKFEIWKDEISNHHSLFSVVDFQPGDIVCEFGAAAILPAALSSHGTSRNQRTYLFTTGRAAVH